jgi:hypothetical protein
MDAGQSALGPVIKLYTTIPESSLIEKLDIAIEIVRKYQNNDIDELLKYIKEKTLFI